MKIRESKHYITNKGIEVWEEGVDLELDKLKVGDKVLVYDCDYRMNGTPYPDLSMFYIDEITNINLEKGFITLGNHFNYKQDKEVYYPYQGYKEITHLNRFTRTKDVLEFIERKCYDFKRKRIGITNIHPRYAYLYTDENQKIIKDFVEEVRSLDIQRAKEAAELARKREIYNKHQVEYDRIINPLKCQLLALEKHIEQMREAAFDECFCKHCKTNNDFKCAHEKEFYSRKVIIDHKIECDGELYRTRPIEKCKYFEEIEEEEHDN